MTSFHHLQPRPQFNDIMMCFFFVREDKHIRGGCVVCMYILIKMISEIERFVYFVYFYHLVLFRSRCDIIYTIPLSRFPPNTMYYVQKSAVLHKNKMPHTYVSICVHMSTCKYVFIYLCTFHYLCSVYYTRLLTLKFLRIL